MLVSIPPYLSVAQFVGFLKSKSALQIFDRHANLKYKYGRRTFWARGYYADTVGRNEKVIKEYIKNQLEEDYMVDQISLKEYIDPFTGNKRDRYAAKHPFCEECRKKRLLRPVEEVHHKLALAEGETHDEENLVSLCKPCYARIHAEQGDRWNKKATNNRSNKFL